MTTIAAAIMIVLAAIGVVCLLDKLIDIFHHLNDETDDESQRH